MLILLRFASLVLIIYFSAVIGSLLNFIVPLATSYYSVLSKYVTVKFG